MKPITHEPEDPGIKRPPAAAPPDAGLRPRDENRVRSTQDVGAYYVHAAEQGDGFVPMQDTIACVDILQING